MEVHANNPQCGLRGDPIIRKRVVSQKLGVVQHVVGGKEPPSLQEVIQSIDSLSSQLFGQNEGQQLKLLREINKKILTIKEMPPLERKRAKRISQQSKTRKDVFSQTEANIRITATSSKKLKKASFDTLRLINGFKEKFLEKPQKQARPQKRTITALSEKKPKELLESLSIVESLLLGIEDKTEEEQAATSQRVRDSLSDFEEDSSPGMKKTKLDSGKVKETLVRLAQIKQRVAKSAKEQEFLVLLEYIEKRFITDIGKVTTDIFKEVLRSPSPLDVLQKEFSLIQSMYGADTRFRPFLHDVQKLIFFFQKRPTEETKLFLVPLLQGTLLPDPPLITTPMQGRELAAQALYILDRKPDNFSSIATSDFQQSIQNLSEQARLLSSQSAINNRNSLESSYGVVYDKEKLEKIFMPTEVARQLVLSDGSLNLGFVSIVKDTLLSERRQIEKETMSFSQHIATTLHHLQSDEETTTKLESIPPPKKGGVGARTVNAMLLQPNDFPVTAQNTHIIVLASLLMWQRQGVLGLCFMHALQHQIADASLRWLVDDFSELLAKDGILKRTIDGNDSNFLGLAIAERVVVKKEISRQQTQDVFSIPSVKRACEQLGCTSFQEFEEIVQSLGDKCTLEDVFVALCKKQGLDGDAVRRAAWSVEAPQNMLLLTLWTNAMVSMTAYPVISPKIQGKTIGSTLSKYLVAMIDTFAKIAETVQMPLVKNEMKVHSRTLFQSYLPTEKPLSDPVFHSEYMTQTMLSAQKEFSEVLAPLSKLRVLAVPVSKVTADYSWTFHIENQGTIRPLRDEKEFCDFLRNAFCECCQILRKTVNSVALKKISQEDFINRFKQAYNNSWDDKVEESSNQKLLLDMFGYDYAAGGRDIFTVCERSSLIIEKPENLMPEDLEREEKVRIILNYIQKLRNTHTVGSELTATISGWGHIFRLLPNHPSLQLNDIDKKMLTIKEKLNSLFCKSYSDLLFSFQLEGALLSDRERAVVVRSLEESPSKKPLEKIPEITFGDELKKFISIIEKQYEKELSKKCPQEFIDQIVLQKLVDELGAESKNLFMSFADTNWQEGSLPLYYTLFFNPLSDSWVVASTVASSQRERPLLVYEVEGNFFEHFAGGGDIAPIAQEVKRKDLLNINRVVSKRLFQIEDSFIKCWKKFTKTSPKEEDRELIRKETSASQPPLFETTNLADLLDQSKKKEEKDLQTAEALFHECITLRSMYQAILRKHFNPTPNKEYRFSVFLEKEETAKYLTDDDAFFQATHTLLFPDSIWECF